MIDFVNSKRFNAVGKARHGDRSYAARIQWIPFTRSSVRSESSGTCHSPIIQPYRPSVFRAMCSAHCQLSNYLGYISYSVTYPDLLNSNLLL